MNIIIAYINNQCIFDSDSMIKYLIFFIICILLLIFNVIMCIITNLMIKYSNKISLKHDIILVSIGDNDEKLLLTNASDIEYVKFYIADTTDSDKIKYVYNYYTDEEYKIINGIDFVKLDCNNFDT